MAMQAERDAVLFYTEAQILSVNPKAKKITTKGGDTFAYDRAVLSPGVDFKWETIEGYDAKVAQKIPHA